MSGRLPRLVATDLDGTIVRSDDTVSEYTHAVLKRLKGAGVTLVGATGRGPRLIDLTRRDIPSADFLVMAGGGRVVDLADTDRPRVLRDERIDGAVMADLLVRLEARVGSLSVLVEAGDGPEEPLWGDPDPSWRYPDVVERRTREEALVGPVIKAFARSSVYHVDTLLAAARQVVPVEAATVTQAGMGYIEICPPDVDKATGLGFVVKHLGVDPADVLVFGDMPNDVPMFEWAGYRRVAVANAHPEVRRLADEVASSNDEDGVAVYLDAMLAG